MRVRANKDQLAEVQGIALDAFGTTLTGSSMISFAPWLQETKSRRERREILDDWMKGLIGPKELVRLAGTAPTVEVMIENMRADFDNITPYPDVPAVLETLQGRGYRMVTISNLVAPFGEALEQRLGRWMEGFVLSYELGALKPDQRLFRAAAEILGLPPGRVVMVGDSTAADVRGAQSVGMPSILVDRRGEQPDSVATLQPLLDCLPGL